MALLRLRRPGRPARQHVEHPGRGHLRRGQLALARPPPAGPPARDAWARSCGCRPTTSARSSATASWPSTAWPPASGRPSRSSGRGCRPGRPRAPRPAASRPSAARASANASGAGPSGVRVADRASSGLRSPAARCGGRGTSKSASACRIATSARMATAAMRQSISLPDRLSAAATGAVEGGGLVVVRAGCGRDERRPGQQAPEVVEVAFVPGTGQHLHAGSARSVRDLLVEEIVDPAGRPDSRCRGGTPPRPTCPPGSSRRGRARISSRSPSQPEPRRPTGGFESRGVPRPAYRRAKFTASRLVVEAVPLHDRSAGVARRYRCWCVDIHQRYTSAVEPATRRLSTPGGRGPRGGAASPCRP